MYNTTTASRAIVLSASLLVLATGATIARAPADFTVHEWGTFLAMNGSDGVTLDGMYHEEHALPAFVHSRSKDQLRVPSVSVKGETPVIYFYTDAPRSVEVRVRFPRGLWTQWYPQAEYNGPLTAQAGSPPHRLHLAALSEAGRVNTVPNGQAIVHRWQPMHRSSITIFAPDFGSTAIALTGQAFMHHASSHCRQVYGA